MRRFIVSVVLFLAPLAHADFTKAREAFLADSAVRQAMAQIPDGYRIDDDVQAMTIKTNCGWAGCFETDLVSVRVVPVDQPVNPRSWSITAKVVVHEGMIASTVEMLAADFFDHRAPSHGSGMSGGCIR